MGMFDHVVCEYPLPGDAGELTGWQSKDTPSQTLDTYTIRADGTLWGEDYDIEDHSDPHAEGIKALYGMMTRVNHRPVKLDNFTGEIRFYTARGRDYVNDWVEFSAYFVKGQLQQMNQISGADNDKSNEADQ